VVILVVAVFALRNPRNKVAAAGTPTSTETVTIAPPSDTVSAPPSGSSATRPSTSASSPVKHSLKDTITLVVLNNTSQVGLAKQATDTFEAGGWHVTSYADGYHNDILSTAAYFDPLTDRARQAALALQKQFPAIKRVVPKFSGLPAGPVVVVLDPDYTSG
jgi:hypothetical protein